MKIQVTKAEYEKLCQEIWLHNRQYYVEHQPLISDEEYDHLFKRLEQIEKEHPEWVAPTSPTQRVGESLTTGYQTIAHEVPMLSLANTYSDEELASFIKRMQKLRDKSDITLSCELKMDGIAIAATYRNGIFVQGLTRGDGWKGDDITQNLKTIGALPLQLYGNHIPDFLDLRGEVYMTHKVFKDLNQERTRKEEPLWANPRNAAAGSLKLLDPREAAKRRLSVLFYGIAENSHVSLSSQFETHAYLKSLGLPVLQSIAKCHSVEEIMAYAEKVRQMRGSLDYDIDGIVIKLDDLREQKRLGSTGKNPRWAVAYKFAATQAVTRIKEITVQVGRTGILTPVAELDPVFLAGSLIARATLHNQDEIDRKDIRIGDMATIEKGGDVIPKVVKVDHSARSADSYAWKMPAHCPSCGSPVVKVPGEVAVRCPNSEQCPDQSLRRLLHFTNKSAFDIENLGEKVMEQLVDKGFVKSFSDIFSLTAEQLYQLEGFKDKSVKNLLDSIEKAKHVSLDRFIMGLGIKHVGSGTAELLANRAGSLEALSAMTSEDLIKIEGIGEKVAQSVSEFFNDPRNIEEIKNLLVRGVTPQTQEAETFTGHAFAGKTFVLTGTLHRYTRPAAATLIKQRGGKVTDSVSKKTDFVVAGEAPGSKVDKAHALGIPILTEEQFEELL